METVDSILQFWFGSASGDADVAREQSTLWWKKSTETDARIRDRFAGILEDVVNGRRDEWLADARGHLAMIITTDQFPRNIYRETPRAFASDHVALRLCKQGLDGGIDRLLRPIERVFFYLPLEHSESLDDQDQSVALFTALADGVAQDQREPFTGFVGYAVRHREVIERFGRFPHRNAILGRASSEEEEAFLKQPGSSF